jgi:hypothetical protein
LQRLSRADVRGTRLYELIFYTSLSHSAIGEGEQAVPSAPAYSSP